MIPTELHLKCVPTGIPVMIPLSSSQSTDTANGPSSSRSTNTASSPSTENGEINDDRHSLLQVNIDAKTKKVMLHSHMHANHLVVTKILPVCLCVLVLVCVLVRMERRGNLLDICFSCPEVIEVSCV